MWYISPSTAMGRADCHSHLKFPLQGISHSIDQMRLSHNLPATKNLISILFIFTRDIGISPKNQSSTGSSRWQQHPKPTPKLETTD